MTATVQPQANGRARPVTLAPLHLPERGPMSVSGRPQQGAPGQPPGKDDRNLTPDSPGQPCTIPDDPGRRRRAVDGDTVIRVLAAAVVLAVAAFAAIVSYSHIFELGRAHGQDGAAARLLPLSVDGLIASASLVMLHAARRELSVPWLARAMLALGVGATVAANVGYGLPFGWLSAVVSAWPAVAFVGSVEMAVRFVRDARHDGAGNASSGVSDDDRKTGADPASAALEPPQDDRHKTFAESAVRSSPRPSRRPSKRMSGRDRATAVIKKDGMLTDREVAKRADVSESTARRARTSLAGND